MPESSTSPRKEEYMNQSKKMVLTAYEALDEKKGEEIRIIGIGEISILADYFIIAGGASKPQLQPKPSRTISGIRWCAVCI